jgi:hypothetical protein
MGHGGAERCETDEADEAVEAQAGIRYLGAGEQDQSGV